MQGAPFTRILVATRGQPWSQRALHMAVQMAKACHLPLVIVAVVTPSYVPQKKAAWGIGTTFGMEEDQRRLAESVLENAASIAKAMEIDHVCELREGRAADAILKAAAEHQCDLIIIGSRGLKGVSRVTQGETGNEVVLKASVPVMVVK